MKDILLGNCLPKALHSCAPLVAIHLKCPINGIRNTFRVVRIDQNRVRMKLRCRPGELTQYQNAPIYAAYAILFCHKIHTIL